MKRLIAVILVALAAAAPAYAVPEPTATIRSALQRTFPGEYRTARCVAWHESRYNRRAVSPTGDYGLMQINRAAHDNWVDFGRIFNLSYNLHVARRIYLSAKRQHGNGWLPWSAYRRHCR